MFPLDWVGKQVGKPDPRLHPSSPPAGCVTTAKFPNFSETQFSIYKNEDGDDLEVAKRVKLYNAGKVKVRVP